MIIKGGSRSGGSFWAAHLKSEKEIGDKANQRIEVLETRGTAAQDIDGFFHEIGGMAAGTRCKNHFYVVSMNPMGNEKLSREQWFEAFDRLEKNLGLEGQPRLIVLHEKSDEREHGHAAWLRVNEHGRTISDSLNYQKHERTARELEMEFGLERGISTLEPSRETPRAERRPRDQEAFRGNKSGVEVEALRDVVRGLIDRSDGGRAFAAALPEHSLALARGDRRDFCIVDVMGDAHSLGRLAGIKAPELRAYMDGVDRAALPSVGEARETQRAAFTRENGFDRGAAAETWAEVVREFAPQRGAAIEQPEIGWQQSVGEPRSMETPAAPAQPWEPNKAYQAARSAFDNAWRAELNSPDEIGEGRTFLQQLNKDGYLVAQITKSDAELSRSDRLRAESVGGHATEFKPGEFVLIAREGQTYRLGYGLCQGQERDVTETLKAMKPSAFVGREEGRAMQRAARNPDFERSGTGALEQGPGRDSGGPSMGRSVNFIGDQLGKIGDTLADLLTLGGANGGVDSDQSPDQQLSEDMSMQQERAADNLVEIQSGMDTRSDYGNATSEDLNNRAAGNGSAMAERIRREMEERERYGGRERER